MSYEAAGTLVRRSPIAGTWYPGDPATLRRVVRALLDAVEPVELDGELVGLVEPHAGIRFSGPVAAAGYRLVESRRFDTAVLVGPSHYVYFQGASIFPRGAFETPLGRVPIDEELAMAIAAADRRIQFIGPAHDREHCLEMQLPFLQVVAPDIRIVPIVMGDQRRSNVEVVAAAVAGAVAQAGKRVLLVASSDLSHYKPASVAARMDDEVIARVERLDAEGLMALLEASHEHACGGGPIVATMIAARALGARTARILRYGDSGDVTGDKSEVVGYLSAALLR